MVSLPNFRITDTYKVYKSRERTFTSWLRATGEKLGVKLPNSQNRTERIEAAKHDVSISDMQKLVNLCIQRGEALPDEVRRNLNDVVSKRKEAAGFYKPKGDKKSDETHSYYLQILQWALEQFKDLKATTVAMGTNVGTNVDKDEIAPIGNTFESLEIETTVDAGALSEPGDYSDTDDMRRKKSKSKIHVKKKGGGKRSRKPTKAVSKAEKLSENELLDTLIAMRQAQAMDENDYEEACFIIYCFFKDWNAMREYIQERWCDYQDGLLSLSIVSVITNTAFDLLQKSEQELLELLPRNSEFRDFGAIANMLFLDGYLIRVDYHAQNNMEEHGEDIDDALYDEADWICMTAFWSLIEWLKNTPPKKVPTLKHMFRKPVKYHQSSSRGKIDRDRQILYELIGECCLLKAMKLDPVFDVPAEDEWTKGIIKMLATRHIPIWLVFASQTMCDIRYILEDGVLKCHDELRCMGDRVGHIMTQYINFSNSLSMPENRMFEGILGECKWMLINDFMEPSRSKLQMSVGIPKSEIEEFYYLRRQPLLCGLMKFRFSLSMNEIGLGNANQGGATIACAHLYNALRHELPSFPQWPDMEGLIFIHSNQRIFWQDDLPHDRAQYSRAYDRATRVGDMMAQRALELAGKRTKLFKDTDERGMGRGAILSMQFFERFCYFQPGIIDSLPDIERVLNDSAQQEIEYSLAGLRLLENAETSSGLSETSGQEVTLYRQAPEHLTSRALTAQFQQTGTLTNLELLEALGTRLKQEAYALNFDYFSFHTTCMSMLKAVYEEFEKDITAANTALNWSYGEMPVVPYWLFKWMEDDDKKVEITERLQKVMAPLIKQGGITELKALQQFLAGDSADEWQEDYEGLPALEAPEE